jgi:hypothetical protein
MTTFLAPAYITMQESADPQMIGRVSALNALTFYGSNVIDGLLVGVVASAFGPLAVLSGGGAVVALAGAIGLALFPRLGVAGDQRLLEALDRILAENSRRRAEPTEGLTPPKPGPGKHADDQGAVGVTFSLLAGGVAGTAAGLAWLGWVSGAVTGVVAVAVVTVTWLIPQLRR